VLGRSTFQLSNSFMGELFITPKQRIKTVNLSTFLTLFSNSEVLVAAVSEFLILGRGNLDLIGCALNEG